MRTAPFLSLFTFTIAVFVIQAAIPESVLLRQLITVTYLYAIWLALSASNARVAVRALLLGVWATTVALRVLSVPGMELVFMVASRLSGALLLAVCVVSIGRFMLISPRVTTDTLFAAAVVYVLSASAFGQLFTALHILIPDAFLVPEHLAHQVATNPDQLFNYFSFVTMATLGYGEILPRHPLVQVLVSLETVMGQLYVAVVVAWLVGHAVNTKTVVPPEKRDHQ